MNLEHVIISSNNQFTEEQMSEIESKLGLNIKSYVNMPVLCKKRVYNKTNVEIWHGDIVKQDVDIIVNAANSQGLGCFSPGHNCVDNVIHRNAGPRLRDECRKFMKEIKLLKTDPMVTRSFGKIHSKYIFHVVGPIISKKIVSEEEAIMLSDCYLNCLNMARDLNLKSIAFVCISTGVFGFPQEEAAKIALNTTTEWIKDNYLERVVFTCFSESDKIIYEKLLN